MRKNISIKRMFIIFFMLLSMLLSNITSFAYNIDDIIASNAVAIEAETGKILFGKNHKEKLYPASTTKVWTAYLVIKYTKNLDELVEIKSDLSWVEPSSMFLKVGEKFTVRELLEVLMLKSANDVAVALAEYVCGSVEDFAKLMNYEAKLIGCKNTNFVNPNGLPDENHYSTAYDMALIAREATTNKTLKEIANTTSISLPANEIYPHERHYKNTNKFLTGGGTINYNNEEIDIKYDIVDGLKTGYTSIAGRCLLSTANLNGTKIIVGVFNSKGDNVYLDSRKIIDYSLDRYKSKLLINKNEFKATKNLFFNKSNIEGYIKDDYILVEDKYSEARSVEVYDYNVKFNDDIELPIKKDSIVGTVEITKNGEILDTVELLSSNDVDKSSFLSIFKIAFKVIVFIVILLTLFLIIYSFLYIRNKKKKRNNYKKSNTASIYNNRRR